MVEVLDVRGTDVSREGVEEVVEKMEGCRVISDYVEEGVEDGDEWPKRLPL